MRWQKMFWTLSKVQSLWNQVTCTWDSYKTTILEPMVFVSMVKIQPIFNYHLIVNTSNPSKPILAKIHWILTIEANTMGPKNMVVLRLHDGSALDVSAPDCSALLFQLQDFSAPRLFSSKTFQPQDFSAPWLFSSKTFQLQDFSAPIFSAPRLFSSKTFQLLDFSAPRCFSS